MCKTTIWENIKNRVQFLQKQERRYPFDGLPELGLALCEEIERIYLNISRLEERIKMKQNELKVYYGGGLNQELDKALEKVLKPFGYEIWASGMDTEGIRDLAFDKQSNSQSTQPHRVGRE